MAYTYLGELGFLPLGKGYHSHTRDCQRKTSLAVILHTYWVVLYQQHPNLNSTSNSCSSRLRRPKTKRI